MCSTCGDVVESVALGVSEVGTDILFPLDVDGDRGSGAHGVRPVPSTHLVLVGAIENPIAGRAVDECHDSAFARVGTL